MKEDLKKRIQVMFPEKLTDEQLRFYGELVAHVVTNQLQIHVTKIGVEGKTLKELQRFCDELRSDIE